MTTFLKRLKLSDRRKKSRRKSRSPPSLQRKPKRKTRKHRSLRNSSAGQAIQRNNRLLLILGGALHSDNGDSQLGAVFQRLAEKQPDNLDIVVVDPAPGTHKPRKVWMIKYYQVTIEDFFAKQVEENHFFERYGHVAILDDMYFTTDRDGTGLLGDALGRHSIMEQPAFQKLSALVLQDPVKFSWWRFAGSSSSLVRCNPRFTFASPFDYAKANPFGTGLQNLLARKFRIVEPDLEIWYSHEIPGRKNNGKAPRLLKMLHMGFSFADSEQQTAFVACLQAHLVNELKDKVIAGKFSAWAMVLGMNIRGDAFDFKTGSIQLGTSPLKLAKYEGCLAALMQLDSISGQSVRNYMNLVSAGGACP